MSYAPRPTMGPLRQTSSVGGSVAAGNQSTVLQNRVAEKRAELDNLKQLRDLSAAVAAQMEALEQKLATLSDGTEGRRSRAPLEAVTFRSMLIDEAIATVLANWHNVLRAINMASGRAASHRFELQVLWTANLRLQRNFRNLHMPIHSPSLRPSPQYHCRRHWSAFRRSTRRRCKHRSKAAAYWRTRRRHLKMAQLMECREAKALDRVAHKPTLQVGSQSCPRGRSNPRASKTPRLDGFDAAPKRQFAGIQLQPVTAKNSPCDPDMNADGGPSFTSRAIGPLL